MLIPSSIWLDLPIELFSHGYAAFVGSEGRALLASMFRVSPMAFQGA